MLGYPLQDITARFKEFKVALFGCLRNKGGYTVVIADQVMLGYQAAKAFHFIGQHGVGQHQAHILLADKDDLAGFKRLYIAAGWFPG